MRLPGGCASCPSHSSRLSRRHSWHCIAVRNTSSGGGTPSPARLSTLPTDSSALEAGPAPGAPCAAASGCHGAQGEGQVFFSEPRIATIVAPNLIRAMTTCSDAEPDGIIRHGVRPNGRTVLGMPSSAFLLLRDDDFARVITFLRSIPPAEGPGPTCRSVRSVGLACSRASSRWAPRWSARRSARGVRELRLMSEVARARFSQFNDAELQALFA